MADSISNSEDIIDSRDVIKRIEELADERQELVDAITEARTAVDESAEDISPEDLADLQSAASDADDALAAWDESDDGAELKALQALQKQAEGYSDWIHGATLIRDSHFEDYARELAEELVGYKKIRDAEWPFSCINWEQAATVLQGDYTSVDFDGIDYWIH